MIASEHVSVAADSAAVSRSRLARLCRGEAIDAMAASRWLHRLPRGLLDRYLNRPVDILVDRLAQFDSRIDRVGLAKASGWALSQWTAGLTVIGQDNIPAGGSLLIVSNHPGMVDALAVLSQLRSQDIQVLVAERPLLNGLPSLRRHMIAIPELQHGRAVAVRAAARHLQTGGTLLTYPAGSIEPDPAVRPQDALASLARWSASTDCLRRLLPDLTVLPVIVSGVLAPRHRNTLLARHCPDEDTRDWLAATRQALQPECGDIWPTLHIGMPLRAPGRQVIHGRLLDEVADLLVQDQAKQPVAMPGRRHLSSVAR